MLIVGTATETMESKMIPRRRIPVHPGKVLQNEFLGPLGLTQAKLAAHIGVSVQRIDGIIHGKRRITPNIAWLLSQAFSDLCLNDLDHQRLRDELGECFGLAGRRGCRDSRAGVREESEQGKTGRHESHCGCGLQVSHLPGNVRGGVASGRGDGRRVRTPVSGACGARTPARGVRH